MLESVSCDSGVIKAVEAKRKTRSKRCVLCVVMTEELPEFSQGHGNDPARRRRNAEPGDQCCHYVLHWEAALYAGVAPPVVSESTNFSALDFIDAGVLPYFDHRDPGLGQEPTRSASRIKA
ncbi:MAG: DUF2237 family protein [Pseudomonadota bacterium]